MHTLTKIKLFRAILWATYPIALLVLYPLALFRKKKSTRYFFLLDRYELGGAQRVHIDILQSIQDQNKQVYFTRVSKNSLLKDEFYSIRNTSLDDIHVWCDNLLFRIFSIHYFAFYINRHKDAIVLSSNSTYFYDMLPFFKKRVYKAELLHNFTYGKKGMEFFGLGNHKYLDARLCVDNATANNIKNQYAEYHVPAEYNERVQVIEPGVQVPATYHKDIKLPLVLFYAGRGGPQKRVYLLSKVAEICIQERLPVHFHFAGPMEDELSDVVKQHETVHGNVDKNKMNELYDISHAIVMTSAFEGFPMLVKEGMAHGCIPLVTALDGNKTHLRNNDNALLITEVIDEDKLVTECMDHVRHLVANMEETKRLSANAYQYAKDHFDRANFLRSYRAFLLQSKIK